jgi:chlorobactene glucosyltransferase
MVLLLSLAFAFSILFGMTLIFLRNWLYLKPIHEIPVVEELTFKPLVSICIPARNEEFSINTCVRSALNQTYSNCEILVLDDESDDKTSEILTGIQENVDGKLIILSGTPKPENWLGKNWACHQLSDASKGEILVFIDADVQLEPHTIDALVTRMTQDSKIGLLSVWPEQILITFWEQVLVPMVYYTLLGFLYLRYTEKPPRWIPIWFRKFFAPLFAAACGQFMAFRKDVYNEIGGHKSVKNKVVEDVELARLCIKNEYKVVNLSGKDAVYCRMYRSYNEIKQGFRKNFFSGFGESFLLFVFSGILHLITFILPLFLIIYYAKIEFWYGALLAYCVLLIPVFHRYMLLMHFNWKIRFAFSHILGVLWFQYLGLLVIIDKLFGRKTAWKGRKLN